MIKLIGFLCFFNILYLQCFACVFKDVAPGLQGARVKSSNIYTIFSQHFAPEITDPIIDDILIKDSQQSVAEIKKNLTKNKQFILQQRRKINYLKQLIAKKKIDWLGVEWSPKQDELNKNSINDYISTRKILVQVYASALTDQDVEDMLSMIFPEDIRLMGQYKMRNQSFPIKRIPLEHDSIKEETIKIVDKSSKIFKELYAKATEINLSSTTRNAINGVVDEIYAKLYSTASGYDMDKIETYISKVQDLQIKKMLQDFVRLKQKETMLHYRREVSIASKVSKLNGNGLIILGTAHKTGLLSEITSICKSSLRSDEGYSEGIE